LFERLQDCKVAVLRKRFKSSDQMLCGSQF